MRSSSLRRLIEGRIRPVVVALSVVVAAAGCARQPAAAGNCRGERDRARAVARTIKEEWPLRSADEVTQLVKDVVRRLAAAQSSHRWEIVIIRNRKAEAYSIGDGRIYISDGAVRTCETESELAAVLAHEMAHQMLGHFCQAADSTGSRIHQPESVGSITLRIDPERELDADRYGLDLISRVGYDPQAALRVAKRVQAATSGGHLDSAGRVARLERLLSSYLPRTGFQSAQFVRVRQLLLTETRLGEAIPPVQGR